MSRRIFLTVTLTSILVILFSIGALFDAITAPAIGGIALAYCAMTFIHTLHQENSRQLTSAEKLEILRDLQKIPTQTSEQQWQQS